MEKTAANYIVHIKLPSLETVLLAVLEYGWALVLVLNGNSVYNANADRNYHLMPLCVVMTVALLLVNLLLGKIGLKRGHLLVAVLLCLHAGIYLAVRFFTLSAQVYVFLFLVGLPCLYLLFAQLHRKGRLMPLMHRLTNVIVVLCAISLFFWVFGTALGILKTNMSTHIRWGNYDEVKGYWGLHFNIQRYKLFGRWFYRNTGIFTEAPMLNLWANIGLAGQLFLQKKPSLLKIGILLGTIITSLSTTGMLFIVLCFGLKYLGSFLRGGRAQKALLIAAAIILVPVALGVVYVLLEAKADTNSFTRRMADYISGLRLWMDYPMFGSGFGVLDPLMQYITSLNGNYGFSNSVAAVLGTGGLWVALMYYVPHVAVIFPRATRSRAFSMYGLCMLYLFITTIFFTRYLAVVLIALNLAVLLESDRCGSIPQA